MKEFEKLGIGKEILRVIEELGFEKPSEIQEKAIPLVLHGRDVIGNSATGSGKTLVFGSAIIEKSEIGKGMQALVLTPTRELAEQVTQTLRIFSKYKKMRVQEVYGGVGISNQVIGIKKAEVVVGTPGRILDHLRRGTLKLSKVKILVLDEADRMVDMGFLPNVEEIIKLNPRERQTLLFSATNTQDVGYIARNYMKNPWHVVAEAFVDPSKLNQHYYDISHERKFSLLVHLLKQESKLVMVFCNTRRTSDFVARNLTKNKLDAVSIHGGLSQARRNVIMKKFHSGKLMILVCTDVAARGLDIKNVSHVYNYDIPKTANDYIHRIGRTARAGKIGDAISLVSSRDYMSFNNVQMEESLNIKNEELPEFKNLYVEVRGGHGQDDRRRRFGNQRQSERKSFSSSRRGFKGKDNQSNWRNGYSKENSGGFKRKSFDDSRRRDGGRRFNNSNRRYADKRRFSRRR